MPHAEGHVVMLIGTSSSGKTTTAVALQTHLAEHHLLLGLDVFFRMIDPRWGGRGTRTRQGFRYDPSTTDDSGQPHSTISYGAVGRQILEGTHRAVAALARSGNHVIVDEMLLDHTVLSDWRSALEGLRVHLVQVEAPVDVLTARESHRGQHPGLARGHLAVNRLASPDLTVDTSRQNPEQCAALIAQVIG